MKLPEIIILQNLAQLLLKLRKMVNFDINQYHRDNGSVEPPKKKKKVASKQTVDNDDTVIKDEEEYLNSSQFSANESDDNEIEIANSNEAPVDPTSIFLLRLSLVHMKLPEIIILQNLAQLLLKLRQMVNTHCHCHFISTPILYSPCTF